MTSFWGPHSTQKLVEIHIKCFLKKLFEWMKNASKQGYYYSCGRTLNSGFFAAVVVNKYTLEIVSFVKGTLNSLSPKIAY